MLHPRQAFPDAERLMAIGRALRESSAVIVDSNVIRFPVERLKPRNR
jgi:hypothetical protein